MISVRPCNKRSCDGLGRSSLPISHPPHTSLSLPCLPPTIFFRAAWVDSSPSLPQPTRPSAHLDYAAPKQPSPRAVVPLGGIFALRHCTSLILRALRPGPASGIRLLDASARPPPSPVAAHARLGLRLAQRPLARVLSKFAF